MANKKPLVRGTTNNQEIRDDYIVRDTRPFLIKLRDGLGSPTNLGVTLLTMAFIVILFPPIGDITAMLAALMAWWGMKRREEAPLKLPAQSKVLDPHEIHPGNGKPQMAEGIFFLGNDSQTGKEVWLTNSDCRQHFLVLGTTGAGKTENLIGFAANALTWGSGFLFCDGKGDVSLFAKVYAMARRFGREDDLLVLNYMTGNQDLAAGGGKLRSNTLNPFSTGSSDTLTQMVVGLMDDAGGDGAMWKGRATAMFTGVMRALCWLRDAGEIDLNVSEIRDHLELKRIVKLGEKNHYPDMPQPIRKSIASYLGSLPGYVESKGEKQSQTTLDQHGYLQMQFTKILGSLADVYGHIFHTPYGEIDMSDVVLNRRILVIMLPALEKSRDEISNLGKIVVATLKGMMGSTLGSEIEGDWQAIVENRPTNSSSPFICILDEVGYYMVDGMDLMSAQARSLGFSMIFAGQDINAMKSLNEKVFGSVQGNTNTKIIMRTEDPETAKIAVEGAGEAFRAQMKSYQSRVGEMGKSYGENSEAALERTSRINALDLKAQSEGEMHIIHSDKVVRAKAFYADPPSSLNKRALKLRTNHFITVEKPMASQVEEENSIPLIIERLVNPKFQTELVNDAKNGQKRRGTDEIGRIATVFDALRSKKPITGTKSSETACVAFASVLKANDELNEQFAEVVRTSAPKADRKNRLVEFADDGDVDPIMRDDMGHLGFDGFAPEENEVSSGEPDIDDLLPFEAEEEKPVKKATGKLRQAASKIRDDVKHGVEVDEHEMYDMADRVAANETVMKTLSALDFDEAVATPDSVNSAVEEAVNPGKSSDDGVEPDPFEEEAAMRADTAARSAVPDFFDGMDDGEQGGDEGSPDVISKHLAALMDDEED